jgi:hypothetical protein
MAESEYVPGGLYEVVDYISWDRLTETSPGRTRMDLGSLLINLYGSIFLVLPEMTKIKVYSNTNKKRLVLLAEGQQT